jgi:hypothetical protein
MTEIRSIFTLVREEILALARNQADNFQPMEHHYEAGSVQALTYERAYIERKRELDALSAEVV